MDPNYNFDQDNTTVENNTTETVTPRVIKISQTELGALRNNGYNRSAIAAHYGVTPQELYQVMVGFGMVKQRTEKENLPSYVIEPVYDLPVLSTPVEEVTA
jgi:hypothetical protein